MTATFHLPLDNDFEEPEEAALRVALGVRPVHFDRDTHPALDAAQCPFWCHYGRGEHGHGVDPREPYIATHALGSGPTVAASLSPGELHRADRHEDSSATAAHLDIYADQRGASEPVVRVLLRATDEAPAGLGQKGLKLSVTDAKEFIVALTYVVDVQQGRREPIEEAVDR